MDLYEYQARDLFEKHEVPVLPGIVATTPVEAEQAARDLGCASDVVVEGQGPQATSSSSAVNASTHASDFVVVKAQVKTGGRGKAGGVKLARTPEEAREVAQKILGMDIKGHTVRRVLVAAGADIAREFYFSLLLDRSERRYLAMCSVEGGMEIEQLAAERPEALARVAVDPLVGIDRAKAEEIVEAAGFEPEIGAKVVPVLQRLWDVYHCEDATLVEVNPLVLTGGGEIIALDGKVTLDGNAAFRQPDHEALVDKASEDPLEARANELGLNYVKLHGQVGVIGNGAGLVMSTLDVVAYAGQEHGVGPANFLDIGGGASAEVMSNGLSVILSDSEVRSVFVNVFGGITACDEVARGIVGALELLGDEATKPIVVRLDGNAVEDGRRILAEANHPLVITGDTMDEAAAMAARLAAGVAIDSKLAVEGI